MILCTQWTAAQKKATITLTGGEVAVKFPCTYSVFGIKGDDMLLYPKSGMTQGADGVYDTAEGDGSIVMALHYQTDTVYIKGTGADSGLSGLSGCCHKQVKGIRPRL